MFFAIYIFHSSIALPTQDELDREAKCGSDYN